MSAEPDILVKLCYLPPTETGILVKLCYLPPAKTAV